MAILYRSRTLALAIALAGSLLAVATPANAADPMVGAPEVGACYNYNYAAFMKRTNSSPVVDCAEPHTAITFHVGQLPEGMDWESDEEILSEEVVKQCAMPYQKALGQSLSIQKQTAFEWGSFVPDSATKDQGARWFRCDANVVDWLNTKLIGLPNTKPLLKTLPIPRNLRSCLTAKFKYTVCSNTHRYMADQTFKYPGEKYPGKKKLSAFSKKKCAQKAGRNGYAWYFPGSWDWKYGNDHLIVCYHKD